MTCEQRFLGADGLDRSAVKCDSELVVDYRQGHHMLVARDMLLTKRLTLLSDVEVVSSLELDNLGVNQKDKSVSGHFRIGSSSFG